jgi:hypothetical protein
MGKIKEKILDKIRSDELTMRPRVYFTLKIALLIGILSLILIATVFVFMSIFLIIRMDDRIPMRGREVSDLWLFVRFFPWGLFLADVGLIALLEYLLRKFRFWYTQPVIYVFFAVFAVVISFGLFLDRGTSLNDRMMYRAREHRLPGVMNDFYRGIERRGMGPGGMMGGQY